MFTELTAWLLELVHALFSSVWDWVVDLFIHIVDMVLGVLVSVISAIPVPSSLSGGLQQFWGSLDPGILYFATQFGVVEALGVIGAAYTFRFARKLVTLFQW